jgi:hypothetical protein
MMTQSNVDPVRTYYKSWDTEYGKFYAAYSRRLPMVGEVSFLWSGLLAKSELRQLLDELFEHALEGGSDSRERSLVSEGAVYQR